MLSKIDAHLTGGLTWLTRFLQTNEGMAWVFVLVGCVLRLVEYGHDRGIFLDEARLQVNLVRIPVFDMRTLEAAQLAAPGFLIAERTVGWCVGGSKYALRFIPLVSSIAALFVMHGLARRLLAPRALPVAVAFVALSHDLIYYASEIKQYSTDVLCALGGIWLGLSLLNRPWTSRTAVFGAAAGSLLIWCSHPALFVTAGVGTTLLIDALRARDARRIGLLVAMGACWVFTFLAVYLFSQALLDDHRAMRVFWGMGFPSLRIASVYDARELAWHVLNVYINPLNFMTPLDFLPPIGRGGSVAVGVVLTVLGVRSLARRDLKRLGFLCLPLAFAFAAACLEAYPFHGRLLLYSIPIVSMFMGEGLAALGNRLGRALWLVLVGFVLAMPAGLALWYLPSPRGHAGHSHGDLRGDLDMGVSPSWPRREPAGRR